MATTVQAKTKSGKLVQVLVLDASELSASIEHRAYDAAKLALERGCPHWRIVDTAGQVVQWGRADAPTLTREQAAAISDPANTRRWAGAGREPAEEREHD